MGNCQAIENASLLVQHPNGRVDKLYWPVTASEIMKMNPGHYVALLLTTTICPSNSSTTTTNSTKTTNNNSSIDCKNNNLPVRITRIKLLRPTDTLVLGHVYRLITTQGGFFSFFFSCKLKNCSSKFLFRVFMSFSNMVFGL